MHEPKGLKIIQHAIEKDAEQHGIEVHIEWKAIENNGFAATVYHEEKGKQKIEKPVIFTQFELENASKNNISPETTDKIQKLFSQLPGRNYPPGIMPK